MRALNIFAGPAALAHIRAHGLAPDHVRTVAGAAGGPKGLILGPLDRFVFGSWLAAGTQPVDLVGASIGAWRMATACLQSNTAAFDRLERDYISQHYELPAGARRPSAQQVSQSFRRSLQAFYGGRVHEILHQQRYRLHIMTSHGRHLLRREHGLVTPLGYLGAFASNALGRRALGAWLERVVFSTPGAALPFDTSDFRTRQVALGDPNFLAALQASCSIPFVLQAVHDIEGAPSGAYWDGGITDYHLHLNYQIDNGIVLYPHFQRQVVPGWLDKGLKWRHRATPFLDRVLLLAPTPQWVAALPNGKLPDRTDFARYGQDLAARMAVWNAAASASAQLADEFAAWLRAPDPAQVQPL